MEWVDDWNKVPLLDAGEAPRRSTSSLGAARASSFIHHGHVRHITARSCPDCATGNDSSFGARITVHTGIVDGAGG